MPGDDHNGNSGVSLRVHGKKKDASFQVIVLGATGGPREDQVTGLLVRATHSEWRKGSLIAVDAGAHLASIVRILEQELPLYSKDVPPSGYSQVLQDGPFAGIKCPGYSARANALYVFRELMHAFLITHPHLDHLSGMGINTPALEYGREAKTIVALDSTIEAIKNHIFNDWIWPNLSDEGSGVGFVTYRRLKEGGNARFGTGDARGYVRVCDSLATLCMPVTHGKCKPRITVSSHQRVESAGWHSDYMVAQPRRLSRISDHEGYFAAIHSQQGHNPSQNAYVPQTQPTPGYSSLNTPSVHPLDADHGFEAVKSSAFFILNEDTCQEILVFGDIEPDSVSMSPQNYKVWRTAASKVAAGTLKAIFIECSYDDSVRDADLYGHLCPRHLIGELSFLAKEVLERKGYRRESIEPLPSPLLGQKTANDAIATRDSTRKRKRASGDYTATAESELISGRVNSPGTFISPYVGKRSGRSASAHSLAGDVSPISLRGQSPSRLPKHVHFGTSEKHPGSHLATAEASLSAAHDTSLRIPALEDVEDGGIGVSEKLPEPLKGLTIHVIHVKDTLVDGPTPGEIIAQQLKAHAEEIGLGCDFDVTEFGESIWI